MQYRHADVTPQLDAGAEGLVLRVVSGVCLCDPQLGAGAEGAVLRLMYRV